MNECCICGIIIDINEELCCICREENYTEPFEDDGAYAEDDKED